MILEHTERSVPVPGTASVEEQRLPNFSQVQLFGHCCAGGAHSSGQVKRTFATAL